MEHSPCDLLLLSALIVWRSLRKLVVLYAFFLVKAFYFTLVALLLHFALERRVKVILDVIVGASLQVLSDFRPAVAVLGVEC